MQSIDIILVEINILTICAMNLMKRIPWCHPKRRLFLLCLSSGLYLHYAGPGVFWIGKVANE